MNLAQALAWATGHLTNYRVEEPRLEAELLLAHCLKRKRTDLIIDHERIINRHASECYQGLIRRRSEREPTAYITGSQPFFSLDFIVDRSVLIPRPETELLVENVLKSKAQSPKSILDIGTGSGVIAICLAKHFPGAKVIGLDASTEALVIAKKNAELHQVAGRCQFLQSDLFKNIKGSFDLIVSNPPYVPTADIDGLEPEVRDWGPRGALDGGPDGLQYIRQLIDQSPSFLTPNGRLFFEFGYGQSEKIKTMLENNGNFQTISIAKDYTGIDRIASAQLITSQT